MSERHELYNEQRLKSRRADPEPEVYGVCDMCGSMIFYRAMTGEEKAVPMRKKYDSVAEYDRMWFHLEAAYEGTEAYALAHRDPDHLSDPSYVLCPECGKAIRAMLRK